jgi:DnaJ-class molecular chaperone
MTMDYYRELGVKQDADVQTIKRAFRRMAHKYHPDVSRHDDADERFKRVRAAYEVLSDPDRRAEYDAAEAARRSLRPARKPRGWPTEHVEEAFDPAADLFDDLGHSFFEGFLRDLGLAPDLDDAPDTSLAALVEISLDEAEDGCEVPLKARVPVWCASCDGTGRRGSRPCPSCRGTGSREVMMDAVLELPAGVSHGDRIAVPVDLGRGRTTFVEVEVLITR